MSNEERVVPFQAGDGLQLNLINVRDPDNMAGGPVLLVHGAGVRANLFRAPVAQTLVDALVAEGYDVWLENWRASIDIGPNPWTLEQAAVHDHPYAVRKVVEETGAGSIKAIIHCQGSTSFTMSAIAGLLPQVDTILSNAVSLHPVVPRWSRFKLRYMVPLLFPLLDYLNPYWGVEPPRRWLPRLLVWLTKLTHHECDNTSCRLVSFTYGSGFPALWSHRNLNEATHQWLCEEFKEVPLGFFREMARFVRRGHLFNHEQRDGLPRDFVAQQPQTDARFVFFAGQDNLCFLPASQVQSFHYFDRLNPGRHRLHILPGYGHLDVFMGQHAHRDIFPLMIEALRT